MPTKFQQRVYSIVKRIPRGKTTTYKAIAEKLKTSPRAVG
ncbi:methylated-DNA--protein-cysteine methyltransferase [archaeon BMS3Abin17]|nr:methylated-DNA--protein-cysteine methyltransferase [archaeon BMS3Abin17]